MIITQYGNILRSSVRSLRIMGRATQGVRLINLRENDIIASVASVVVNDENKEVLGEFEEDKTITGENTPEENGKEFDV
jgi:DNA gyrase subunit A